MQRARLLVVHQGSELYGSDRMLLEFLNALQDTRFSISLHVPSDGPLLERAQPFIERLMVEPISVLRLNRIKFLAWLNPLPFIRNLIFALKLLRQHETVVLNSTVLLTYNLLLPFTACQKYIYVHELPVGITCLIFNIMLRLTGATLICNSHATARAYPLIPARRKHVVYNITSYNPVARVEKPASGQIHVLLLGRVSRRKGVDILLQALRNMPQTDRQKFSVRLVGDSFQINDPYSRSIRQMIDDLKSCMEIEHLPFTPYPVQQYAWADIVVVPSIKPESFGLVAIEGMQAGCAVIASAIGALPEIVTHEQTGLLITPNHPIALSDALSFYLHNPDKITSHGSAGRVKAERDFACAVYQEKIKQVLHA